MDIIKFLYGFVPGASLVPDLENKAIISTMRWLTSDISEDKYKTYAALLNKPAIGSWIRYVEGLMENADYLREHGLSWSDVHRMDKMPGTGNISGAYSGVLNYTSSNITKLYK